MIISSLLFSSLGSINVINAAHSSGVLSSGIAVSPSVLRLASTNSTLAASTSRTSTVSRSRTASPSQTDTTLPTYSQWSYTGPESYTPASGQPFQVITKISTNTFTRTPAQTFHDKVVTGVDGELHTFTGWQPRVGIVVQTLISAVPENQTSTSARSYQKWDPRQFDEYYDGKNRPYLATTLPASILSSWSSFTDYGRQQVCTDDFSKLVETQPFLSYTSLARIPYKDPNATPVAQHSYEWIKKVQQNSELLHCCGKCGFEYRSVQLYYWPVEQPNTACYATAGNATRSTSVSASGGLKARAEAPTITPAPSGIVTAIDEDGFI